PIRLCDATRRFEERPAIEYLARNPLLGPAEADPGQDAARTPLEVAPDVLRGEAPVPPHLESGKAVLGAFIHRDDQPRFPRLGVHDERVAGHGEIDVAVTTVEVGKVLAEVAPELLLIVRPLLEPEEALGPGLHDAPQLVVGEGLVPFELDLGNRYALPLLHIEDQPVLSGATLDRLQAVLDRARPVALVRQELTDQVLRRGDPGRVQRCASPEPSRVPHRRGAHVLEAVELDARDVRLFFDFDGEPHPARVAPLGSEDPDILELPRRPEATNGPVDLLPRDGRAHAQAGLADD